MKKWDELPDALTVDQTAKILGLCRNSAYAAIKADEIPSITIGRRIIVPKAALAKMLEISL